MKKINYYLSYFFIILFLYLFIYFIYFFKYLSLDKTHKQLNLQFILLNMNMSRYESQTFILMSAQFFICYCVSHLERNVKLRLLIFDDCFTLTSRSQSYSWPLDASYCYLNKVTAHLSSTFVKLCVHRGSILSLLRNKIFLNKVSYPSCNENFPSPFSSRPNVNKIR